MSETYYLQQIKFAKTQQLVKTFGVKIWNNLPDLCKHENSIQIFKAIFSTFLKFYLIVEKLGLNRMTNVTVHIFILNTLPRL